MRQWSRRGLLLQLSMSLVVGSGMLRRAQGWTEAGRRQSRKPKNGGFRLAHSKMTLHTELVEEKCSQLRQTRSHTHRMVMLTLPAARLAVSQAAAAARASSRTCETKKVEGEKKKRFSHLAYVTHVVTLMKKCFFFFSRRIWKTRVFISVSF